MYWKANNRLFHEEISCVSVVENHLDQVKVAIRVQFHPEAMGQFHKLLFPRNYRCHLKTKLTGKIIKLQRILLK